ncbi:MAG TPA: hypothetical protein ENN49_00905 [Bacteroidales bacterium]|nr:hypothetical protein [Bacteroidales bacterium]
MFNQKSKADKKRFGRKQLEKLLPANANGNMVAIHELLEQNFEVWRGNAQQIDDITIIGFRV